MDVSMVKIEMAVASLKELRQIVLQRVEKTEFEWQQLQSADHAIAELEASLKAEFDSRRGRLGKGSGESPGHTTNLSASPQILGGRDVSRLNELP